MVENGTFTAQKLNKNIRDLLEVTYIQLHTVGKGFTSVSEVPALGVSSGWERKRFPPSS